MPRWGRTKSALGLGAVQVGGSCWFELRMSGKEGAAIQAGCVSVWLSFLFLALDERAPRWPEHSETRA